MAMPKAAKTAELTADTASSAAAAAQRLHRCLRFLPRFAARPQSHQFYQ
jgi:hypothetical protein